MRLHVRFGWVLLLAALGPAAGGQARRSAPGDGADLAALYAQGPHVGPPETAVVGVEVTGIAGDDAARQTRRAAGLVLRCDGFILAPASLFDMSLSVAGRTETAGKQEVAVVFYPGSDRERRVAGRRPRFFARGLGYVALKVDGVHVPAVQTQLSDGLTSGDTIRVIGCAWDPAARRWLPPVVRSARLGERAGRGPEAASREGEDTLSLKFTRYAPEDAVFSFVEPLEGVPPGAVVVGPGGRAIGMVTEAKDGRGAGFLSFDSLDRATNCVAAGSGRIAVPQGRGGEEEDTGFGSQDSGRDDGGTVPQPSTLTPPPSDTMVSVPGGPVVLPAAFRAEQPDMEGAPVACVAPFEIDRYEVTNAQYYAFWTSLPEAERRRQPVQLRYYPATWSPTGAPFPAELEDAPVIGVPLPGAVAYARAQGKRLPTPYEWALAAFGPKGERDLPDWARQYVGERRTAWERVRGRHAEYLHAHPELQREGVFQPSPFQLPWIVQPGAFAFVSQWSKKVMDDEVGPLFGMWRDPGLLLAAGARSFDVSPCGAADMILNAAELVQASPAPPARGAERFMDVAWLPQPPARGDPWTPRHAEALTENERLLPPLSRLYRRAFIGPTMPDVVMISNLAETLSMLGPLSGWQLRFGSGRDTTATTWARGASPYEALGYPAGFQFWREMPRRYRVEMGRPVPFNATDPHARPGPQLYYFLPVGFRCAR